MLHHLALDHGLDHVVQAGILGEQILAGFQLRARLERDHAAEEYERMLVDHALASQEVGDLHDAEPRRDVDHLVGGQRPRCLETRLADGISDAAGEHDQDQQRENGVADDHERIARALGAAGRHRDLLRLQGGTRAARGDPFLLGDRHDRCLVHQQPARKGEQDLAASSITRSGDTTSGKPKHPLGRPGLAETGPRLAGIADTDRAK
jgi:hypothetical protein